MRNAPSAASIPDAQTERLLWLDTLKAIACLMVVMLHCSDGFVRQFGVFDMSDWGFANALHAVTRVCVPLFFMTTGYLFFRENRPKPKNLYRLLGALVFYSALALIARAFLMPETVLPRAVRLPFQPVYYHLWYFYAAIMVYGVAFVVRVRATGDKTEMLALLGAMVLINPTFGSLLAPLGEQPVSQFYNGESVLYILYAIAGGIFGKMHNPSEGKGWLGLAVFVVSVVAIALYTRFASTQAQEFDVTYYRYENVLVIFATLGFFTWVRCVRIARGRLARILRPISQNSLAIYGVHPLVIWIVDPVGRFGTGSVQVDLPMMFGVTIVISLLVGMLVRSVDRRSWVT